MRRFTRRQIVRDLMHYGHNDDEDGDDDGEDDDDDGEDDNNDGEDDDDEFCKT